MGSLASLLSVKGLGKILELTLYYINLMTSYYSTNCWKANLNMLHKEEKVANMVVPKEERKNTAKVRFHVLKNEQERGYRSLKCPKPCFMHLQG